MRRYFIILFLIPICSFGQFKGSGDLSIQADYMDGFILEHKKTISHLITDRPTGARVILSRRLNGANYWEQQYNYPEVGLTLLFLDYKNPIIGKSIALIPHYGIYFTKNKDARSQWKYIMGLGLEYNTNKYDKVENNQNNVLGTSFNFGIVLQLQHQFQLSDRIHLINSIALTHFSNGSIKKPNSGINTLSLNSGLAYIIQPSKAEYRVSEYIPVDKSGFGYTATLSFGTHEAAKIRGGSYPFFVVSGLADKTLSYKSKVGLALEWFYSISLKKQIPYDTELNGKSPDFNRLGLALSHELNLGDYALITQLGYYVYDPYKAFDPVYVRAGLRRYFTKQLFGSLSVKSHYAKAEAAEFAMGWRFK